MREFVITERYIIALGKENLRICLKVYSLDDLQPNLKATPAKTSTPCGYCLLWSQRDIPKIFVEGDRHFKSKPYSYS
jgi:hypothetical protein